MGVSEDVLLADKWKEFWEQLHGEGDSQKTHEGWKGFLRQRYREGGQAFKMRGKLSSRKIQGFHEEEITQHGCVREHSVT